MQIFARLTKVNEADRTVEGIIASEALDRSGEIFDYEKSVPHFKSWSEGIAKATEGKNLGNVRVMHGKVVAGVTKTLNFDDDAKQITVKAEIVDDNEWNKVQKGCYTGFSIGGTYGSKWDDPVLKAQRYEAIPSEYSLVDLPCNPEAQFTVIKADGSEELCKFVTTTDNAEALAKWAEQLTDDERAAVLAKIAPAAPAAQPAAVVVKDHTAQAERLAKAEGADEAGNVIRAVLGMEQVEKGLWTVANFAEVLDGLACITDCSEDEAAWEGDGSKVPAQLRAALKPLADAFLAMAAEEVAEAIKPAGEEVEVLLLAAGGDLTKAMGFDSAKDALAKWSDVFRDLGKAQSDLAERDAQLAKVTGELKEASEAFTKAAAERDDLAGKLEKVSTAYAEVLTKAAPPKGVVRVVPVEKDADADHETLNKLDDSPVLHKDGSVDHEATALKLMKIAHRR